MAQIYRAGIETGHATFELDVPDWDTGRVAVSGAICGPRRNAVRPSRRDEVPVPMVVRRVVTHLALRPAQVEVKV